VTMHCYRRIIPLAIAALSVLLCAALPAAGQMENPEAAVRLERTLSTTHALPGSIFRVTLEIEPRTDLEGVGVRETLPFGWRVHPIETEGAVFKQSDNEWVFTERLTEGSTIVLVYEVTVPPADRLYSDTLPTCFEIAGIFQATVPGFEIPIPGDSLLEISTAIPIPTAIAHLIPGSRDTADEIDLRLDQRIARSQLDRALEFWSTDSVVPWTEGEIIDLPMIEKLTAIYEVCLEVDESLPLSIDPDLVAVRTIETFLPCDSVLLPEGCLDPGLPARSFAVTVEITGTYDAYGVGLSEWFPDTWRVTPVEHAGFVYRPSTTEWIYPDRLPAGETIAVDYLVEVIESTIGSLSTYDGCCGAPAPFVGFVSSGLECSERSVGGETEGFVWNCLPVLLAISRWDVEEDRLDATLSDTLSFPQVQRAINFWLSNTAVPHTCGYTVGYHMLKRIVAYWLAGTPVTGPLPNEAVSACGPDETCVTTVCPTDGACAMTDLQPVEDFVGLPDVPRLSLEIDGVCELTCAAPSTTLRVTAQGGTQPYRYEWRGHGGELLATSDSLTVTEPGAYSAVVISVGGCRVGQQVVITQDIEAPQLSVDVDGVLGCAVEEVTLTASVLGGRPPFIVRWFDAAGTPLATGTKWVTATPGRYTIIAEGANGCSTSATAEVFEDMEAPTVNAGPGGTLTCTRTEIALSPSVIGGRIPFTYRWTGEDGRTVGTGLALTVDAPGTYTLTVTGANGCSASDTVRVDEDVTPPTVEVTSSGPLTCATPIVTLTATITATKEPVVVSWQNASGDEIGSSTRLGVTDPGSYTVRVRGGNGCSTERTIVVGEDIAPPIVTASVAGRLTCDVTDVELRVAVQGGRPPYTYEWTHVSGRTISTGESASAAEPGTYTVLVTGANGCSTSDTVTVSEDIEPPIVEGSASGMLTCNVTRVTLSATVSGGRTPYEIRWKDASGTDLGTGTIGVDRPGRYTVTATGANGCSASDAVTVREDIAAPTVSASVSDELTCNVTEVTLSASIGGGRSPYTIVWTGAAGVHIGTTETITVNTPGTYTVTATGTNGCSASGSVAVARDVTTPTVSVSVDGVLSCAVTEVALSADISEGRPPYEIEWSDASGAVLGSSNTLSVGRPGTYTVTATGANGCTESVTVAVAEDVSTPLVDLGPDPVLSCERQEILLDAVPKGGAAGPYTYKWRGDCCGTLGADATMCVTEPGTYIVTVTGANGCATTDSITVLDGFEPPTVDLGPDRTLTCSEPEVVLCALPIDGCTGPYNYAWESDCCALLPTTPELRVDTAGTYAVIVTDADGRSTTDSVTVHDAIPAPTVDLGPDRTLTCSEPEFVLCALPIDGCTGPYSYAWESDCCTPLSTTPELRVDTSGTYAVTVTDADGRSATDSVTVHDGIPAPTVDLGPDRMLTCAEPEVVLCALPIVGCTGPYSYLWRSDCGELLRTTPELLVSTAGTYTVTVTSADGRSVTDSVTVRDGVEAPTVDLGPDRTLGCCGTALDLIPIVTGGTAPYTYAWYNECDVIVGTEPTLTVTQPGTYLLIVRTVDGCIASDSIAITNP